MENQKHTEKPKSNLLEIEKNETNEETEPL
jgi:hypothetical protein